MQVAILAAIFYGESIGLAGALGLLVGVLGLCLLELPPSAFSSLLHLSSNTQLVEATSTAVASTSPLEGLLATNWFSKGEFWMLLAAQSMAVGTEMVRWVAKFVDPVMATGTTNDTTLQSTQRTKSHSIHEPWP